MKIDFLFLTRTHLVVSVVVATDHQVTKPAEMRAQVSARGSTLRSLDLCSGTAVSPSHYFAQFELRPSHGSMLLHPSQSSFQMDSILRQGGGEGSFLPPVPSEIKM